MMRLHRVLRSYRKEWMISQTDLAKQIGISIATLHNIETNAVVYPSDESREKITAWLFAVAAGDMPMKTKKKSDPESVSLL